MLERWLSALMQQDIAIEEAPIPLPKMAQWIYLYVTDARVTPLQRAILSTLACAGHAQAQRVVLVDKASHANYFSQPLKIQRQVAKLTQDFVNQL